MSQQHRCRGLDPVVGDTYTRPSLSCDVSGALLFRPFDNACGVAGVLGKRLDAPEDLVRESSFLGEGAKSVHGALVCRGDLCRESRELSEVRRALMHLALPTKWVNGEQLVKIYGGNL